MEEECDTMGRVNTLLCAVVSVLYQAFLKFCIAGGCCCCYYLSVLLSVTLATAAASVFQHNRNFFVYFEFVSLFQKK